jgi:hypothetical protein
MGSLMGRRQAIAKAVETADLGSGGALAPEQSEAFIEDIQSSTKFSNRIRFERRTSPTGTINRFGAGSRLIRESEENSDDGYRAGLTFPETPYSANGIRLPFEITLDALHENIEGSTLERRAERRLAKQFAVDLEDLGFNGLGDSATGAEQDYEFLKINKGWLTQLAEDHPDQVIDGSTINGGDISHSHLFAAAELIGEDEADAAEDELIWVGRRSQHLKYIETIAGRATGAGDRALLEGSPASTSPLGHEWLKAGKMPADGLLFCKPEALARVITWEVIHFRVGPETDKELAARKAIFHIWHIKLDHIIIDPDLCVLITNLN